MAICNPLLMKAFKGIEFEYKLDATLKNMGPKTKLGAEQLKGYLKKRGVKETEINQSGLLFKMGDERPKTPEEWLSRLEQLGNPHHVRETRLWGREYEDYVDTPVPQGDKSYGETITTINKPPRYAHPDTHYREQTETINIPPTDIGEFNLHDTRLARELKEQLEEIEYKKEKMFSTFDYPHQALESTEFSALRKEQAEIMGKLDRLINPNHLPDQSLLGWDRGGDVVNINGKDHVMLTEIQSDWAQAERKGEGVFKSRLKKADDIVDAWKPGKNVEVNEETGEVLSVDGITREIYLKAKAMLEKKVIADFPMSLQSFTRYKVIESIRKAIEGGQTRIAIPIDRLQGNLVGSEAVTEVYAKMNLKGLPKEEVDRLNAIKKRIAEDENKEYKPMFDSKLLEGVKKDFKKADFDIDIGFDKVNEQMYHTITINEVPDKPAKFYFYQLLGAVGLGGLADKLKEKEEQQCL